MTPIVFIRLKTGKGEEAKIVTLKALIDTGASATLIQSKYVHNLHQTRDTKTQWKTAEGKFHTSKTIKAEYTMPELHDQRIISHDMHVTNADIGYDVIIGMDIITSLGITIYGDNCTIKWANG